PVLLLAGEPGIGKTRLLLEALQLAQLSGYTVLQGGCHFRGGQEPYAPILQALARHIQRQQFPELRGSLQGCAWLTRLLPELGDAPIEPLPTWHVAPQHEKRLMDRAVLRYLTNIAGPAGTLLVLDDLQWAESDALDLLMLLVRESALPVRV